LSEGVMSRAHLIDIADVSVQFWSVVGEDKHAVYRVIATMEPDYVSSHPDTAPTYVSFHRYNDFKNLSTAVNETKNLPPGSWTSIFAPMALGLAKDLDPEYLNDRAKKLEDFMKNLLSVLKGSDRTRSNDRSELLKFLTADVKTESVKIPDRKDDYQELVDLFKYWNEIPPKPIWEKYVVSVFGTTSAGKSSFMNHIIGMPLCHTSVGQVDTGFTIIEVVSEKEFLKYSGESAAKKMSKEEVMKTEYTSKDPMNDPRYGRVFVVLDSQATLQHYAPRLEELKSGVATSGSIIRTMLINESYLEYLSKEQARLIKSIILIDSKGLEQSTVQSIYEGGRADPERVSVFVKNAAIRAIIMRMSSLSLFLSPVQQFRSSGPQISEFELSALMASNGTQSVEKAAEGLNSVLVKSRVDSEKAAAVAGSSDSVMWSYLKPFLGSWGEVVSIATEFVGKVAGFGGDTSAPAAVAAASAPSASESEKGGGNSRWGNVVFVFTKMDEVKFDRREEKSFWFDVGRVFGQNCHFIETPTSDDCICICLPECLRNKDFDPEMNALEQLKTKIANTASRCLWEEKLDRTIIDMARKIQDIIKKQSYDISKNVTISHLAEICQRAENRLRDQGMARARRQADE